MKKLFALFLVTLLCSCAAPYPESSISSLPEPAPSSGVETSPSEEDISTVFQPAKSLSAMDTVQVYFEQIYLSYATMTDIDLSSLLDMEERYMRNSQLWNQMLNQRRRLIAENEFCYVETEQFPFEIVWLDDDELTDDRLALWENWDRFDEDETLLHFTITGTPGHAYPPQFAVNSEHTIALTLQNEKWKITFHYYPGAVRKFLLRHDLTSISDQEALALLEEEFSSPRDSRIPSIPENATLYDAEAAAQYALQYTETANPAFYHIGDWMGNCANFISQCVSSGFSEGMSESWFAGEGGGSPSWENVGYFWNYAFSSGAMGAQQVSGIAGAQAGDVIQTSSGQSNFNEDEPDEDEPDIPRYNHSLLIVETETMLLAQNSPSCFVYYSDLISADSRILRPVYLVEGGA